MAHLWIREASEGAVGQPAPDEWSLMPLDADAVAIHSAALLRRPTSEPEIWILVGPPVVRVNGNPLDAGIRVLRDRDELRTGGTRTFFSTESLPVMVPFTGGERSTFCPRCKLEVAAGSPAVACPQCRVWHHQSDELPCWTYAERCTMCDQPTALGAGFRWTPEDL